MKPINVEVKQKHIQQGLPLDCTKCPIALALYEAGFGYAYVDEETIEIGETSEQIFWYRAPLSAIAFQDDFDRGVSVKPFNFVLTDLK